jgi:hypothetical protein
MDENNFVLFLKLEINLKVFEILFFKKNVLNFFWNISEKTEYFNTGSVSYSLSIQTCY